VQLPLGQGEEELEVYRFEREKTARISRQAGRFVV
jgi:hypothetical protein